MTNTETLQPSGSRKVLRRIGAVLGGLVLVVILDVSIDVVMHATGVYPPWLKPMSTSLWLFATAYRMIDGTIGGYVAAWLAPDWPIAHALALGVIGLLLSSAGAIASWSQDPEFGPKWYPLALVVVSLPCACLGGFLRARQLRAR